MDAAVPHGGDGAQAAIGKESAYGYASRLEKLQQQQGSRPIHIGTATMDTYRDGNEQLSRELRRRGVKHTLSVPPGVHNQPFLEELGSLEMLLWHDRVLGYGLTG